MQLPRPTLPGRRPPGLGALLPLALCLTLPAPARAAIDGFRIDRIEGLGSLELDDRLSRASKDAEHLINAEDCPSYVGGEAEFAFSLQDFDSNWDYSFALAGAGDSCAKKSPGDWANDDDCHSFVEREEMDQGTTQFSADIPLDWIMGEVEQSEEVDCTTAETEATAKLYVVAEETGVTNTLTQVVDIEVDFVPPEPPLLDEITPGDRQLTVRWDDTENADEDEIEYNVYWSREPIPDDAPDREDGPFRVNEGNTATSVSIESNELVNDVGYNVRVSAEDVADNESELSESMQATPVASQDFWEAYLAAGGTESGGFCFVATAAYGSPMAEELGVLRAFRDRVLRSNAAGRAFVEAYYDWGPFAAAWIADRPVARALARVALTPLVGLAHLLLMPPLAAAGLVGCLLVLLTAARRSVRRRALVGGLG